MNKTHFNEVCGAFLNLKTPREVKLFLEDILTPQEIKSVTERLQIFKLLAKGVPQREICATLNVSISKVSRGAHAWRVSQGGVATAWRRQGKLG